MALTRMQYTTVAGDVQPEVEEGTGILDIDVPVNVDIGEDFVDASALVFVGGRMIPNGTGAWCWERVDATDTIDIFHTTAEGTIITVLYEAV